MLSTSLALHQRNGRTPCAHTLEDDMRSYRGWNDMLCLRVFSSRSLVCDQTAEHNIDVKLCRRVHSSECFVGIKRQPSRQHFVLMPLYVRVYYAALMSDNPSSFWILKPRDSWFALNPDVRIWPSCRRSSRAQYCMLWSCTQWHSLTHRCFKF